MRPTDSMYRDMGMTYWLEGGGGDKGGGMTLRIAALLVIPVPVLVVLLLRPHALFVLPTVVADFLIAIVIILPIVALQTWRSRKI